MSADACVTYIAHLLCAHLAFLHHILYSANHTAAQAVKMAEMQNMMVKLHLVTTVSERTGKGQKIMAVIWAV